MSKRTRIVHLSDLHIKANKTSDSLDALATFLIQVAKPDVIAITGDLVDSPRKQYFRAAEEYLNVISNGTGAEIVICLGNHDYRLKGVFPYKHKPKSAIDGYIETKSLEERSLSFVALDSNTGNSWRFAGGCASRKEMLRVSKELREETASTPIKIALIHHHLLPCVDSEKTTKDRALEPLKTISTPGHVLEALFSGGVCIVLHGHQHVSSRWCLSRGTGKEHSELEVIGNPSSTGKRLSGVGVLDITPKMSAVYSRYILKQPSNEFSLTEGPFELFSTGYFARMSRPKVDKKTHPLNVGRLVRLGTFTPNGDLHLEQVFGKTEANESTKYFPVEHVCDMGVIGEPKIVYYRPLSGGRERKPTYRKKAFVQDKNGLRRETGVIDFGVNRIQKGEVFTLCEKVHITNAFAICREERSVTVDALDLDKQTKNKDGFVWTCNVPVDEFEAWVVFPHLSYLQDLWAEVKDENGTIHEELGASLSNNIVAFGTSKAASMRVVSPTLGYQYTLGWQVPSSDEVELEWETPEIRACREKLVAKKKEVQSAVSSYSSTVADTIGPNVTVGLMAFDKHSRALVQLASTDIPAYESFSLAIGEGVAGRAHKMADTIWWTASAKGDVSSEPWYKEHEAAEKNHVALAALPILPISAKRPLTSNQVACIVIFGTYDDTSRLWRGAQKKLSKEDHRDLSKSLMKTAYRLVYNVIAAQVGGLPGIEDIDIEKVDFNIIHKDTE